MNGKSIVETQAASRWFPWPLGNSRVGTTLTRVLVALLGGWFFTWGFCLFGIAGLTASGMEYGEAVAAAMPIAFLLFLAVFLWAFACGRLARVAYILAGGGTAMTLAAWALQQMLLK